MSAFERPTAPTIKSAPLKRQDLRLAAHNYASSGGYFITLCANIRTEVFGHLTDNEDTPTMQLNPTGAIVEQVWNSLPQRFPYVVLDEFIIMPDHVHGILFLRNVENANDAQSLSAIIGAFKSLTAREINKHLSRTGHFWQRSYYDRVIRNEDELRELRKYIRNNPSRLFLRAKS